MQFAIITKSVHELPRMCLFDLFALPVLAYGFDGILVSGDYLNKSNV